jgi:DNA-binding SARP family transcriptional activator
MEFGLLGPLAVRSGGTVVPVRRGHPRALLAILLLQANRLVTVETIAEAVWGPAPPRSAPVGIRSYVQWLRRAFGEAGQERIITQPRGYLIRVTDGELDVAQFEQLLASAQAAVGSGSWRVAAGRAREALSWWRGKPLEDVGSELLALSEVPRLAELRLLATEIRIEADLRLGGHAEIVTEVQHLRAAYPLREHLHALSMLALYRCGRQAEALECYSDARRVLVRELGVEPGPELRRLHERVLAQDTGLLIPPGNPPLPGGAVGPEMAALSAPRAVKATQRAGLAPVAAPPEAGGRHDNADSSNVVWIESAVSRKFVGREKELGVLQQAWSSAGAGAGHRVLALVAGEPGIGKTALAAELARRVRASGGLVLYGRWDEEVLAPYQGFREALGDYARACPEVLLREDLVDVAGEIACLWPELTRRIGAFTAPPLAAAEAERFRLFESLDSWIQRIAARHPVLLVLDDLHWADRPSLLLFRHLMQARRSTPLLAVAMYHDIELVRSELSAALPSLARDTDCRRLALRGLERDAATELLEAAADRPFPERESAIVSELEQETGGNPFFLLEMARHLSEMGAFDREAGRLAGTLAEIPESVRDLIRWRLGRLSGRCAGVLAVASVIGERFDAALLTSAASLDEATAVDLLEEAAQAGMIAEIDDEPDRWRFSHSLARRVTAAELSRSRKARLHQRIGTTLESRPDVSPAELAHHFGAAASIGSAVKAIGYQRLAGKQALAEVAAEVAVHHFKKALEQLDRFRPSDQTLRCELLLELAGAHDRAGDYMSRDERFAEAADAARRLRNDELFLRAALGYGGILPAAVRADPQAHALLEEALERLGAKGSGATATILARLAHWLHDERPYRERLELSDQSVAMARDTGDRRTLATVLLHRCWALDGPGDAGDALQAAGQILDIGTEFEEPELTLEGLRIKLTAQFEKGEHSAAVQTALLMKQLAEEVRHPEFIRLSAIWDVNVASMEGKFGYAEEMAGELGHWLQRIGHPQAQLIPLAQSFSWRWLQGRAAEYIPVFEALSASQPAELTWPAVTAWCLAEAGARDQAADLLHQMKPALAATADHNFQWWAVIVGFSGAADLLGNRQWAEVLYDLAAPYSGNNCTLGVASFLGAADHWLGVLAGVTGRYPVAIQHLEAALARHRDMGSRPLTALTQEAYGHLLTLRGEEADIERARMLTGSAMRTASELRLAAIRDRRRLRG